jgi:two-component system, LytTR family, response regulator
MNCIVVDDNRLARTAIKLMIDQVDFLQLKHECESPLDAFNILQKEQIDLVFLDVEMPEMNGIELIKNLEKRPIFILISAKKEYAIEAFELNVADYIIKPVSLARFTMAVSRAKELYDSRHRKTETSSDGRDYLFARSNGILVKIRINDIRFVQALGDYVTIHTDKKHYTIHSTLKAMEEKLPAERFYRLHRSYLVAVDHIETVEENTAYLGKQNLPIGEQFKKGLLQKLNLI